LGEIAAAPATLLESAEQPRPDIAAEGAGFREHDPQSFRAILRSSQPTNRRFAFAGLLADQI
jgi:hypothetical protein